MENTIPNHTAVVTLTPVNSISYFYYTMKTSKGSRVCGRFDTIGIFWSNFYMYIPTYNNNKWLKYDRPTNEAELDLEFISRKKREIYAFKTFARRIILPTKGVK